MAEMMAKVSMGQSMLHYMMINSSEGDVVVELCNWKEDKGYHEDSFSFAKMDGYYRSSQWPQHR